MAQVKTSAGEYVDLMMSAGEYIPGGWSYAAASGGIVNSTTAVTISPALAGFRNTIKAIQLSGDALGVATEVAIRDGAAGAVLWRMKIGTVGLVGGSSYIFASPLKGTAGNLLEFLTLTASITGGIYFNAQGGQVP